MLGLDSQINILKRDRIQMEMQEYALRTLPRHCLLANKWKQLYQLLTDFDFLEEKCRFLSVYELEKDYQTVLETFEKKSPLELHSDEILNSRIDNYFKTLKYFYEALSLEAHNINSDRGSFLPQMYNRLQWVSDENILPLIKKAVLSYKNKYWLRLLQQPPNSKVARNLKGHSNGVLSCAISNDNQYIVSGCIDGTLIIWDFSTGEILHTFLGHKTEVNTCVITPDCKSIISGSKDGEIKIWSIKTGIEIYCNSLNIEKHKGSVEACAISLDGKKLISASLDGTVKVWNLAGSQLEHYKTFLGHKGGVRDCAFIGNDHVVSVSNDMSVKVWDIKSGSEFSPKLIHKSKVLSCAVTPNNQTILTGSSDSKVERAVVKRWDSRTYQEQNSFILSNDASVLDIVTLNDNHRVAIALDDHTVRILDIRGMQEKMILRGHSARVMSCAATCDSRYLVSGSKDQSLIIWDLSSKQNIDDRKNHHMDRIWSCSISTDGNYLISGSNDKTIKLWDLHSRRVIRTFFGHEKGVFSCVLSNGNNKLLSSSEDKTIRCWDINSGKEELLIKGHQGPIRSCIYSPDNKLIISGSDDCTVKLWDAATGEIIKTLYGHTKAILYCSALLDNKNIVTVSEDRTFRLWNIDTGLEKAVVIGHKGAISSCDISPNGEYLLTSSYDKSVKLWDLQSLKEIRTFIGHTDRVLNCRIMPDEHHVISISADSCIKLWDIKTGDNVASYIANGDLRCTACSPNGRNIIVGNGLGFLYFFELMTNY